MKSIGIYLPFFEKQAKKIKSLNFPEIRLIFFLIDVDCSCFSEKSTLSESESFMKKIFLPSVLILLCASIAANIYFCMEKCCVKKCAPPVIRKNAPAVPEKQSVKTAKKKQTPIPIFLKRAAWDWRAENRIEVSFYSDRIICDDTVHVGISPQVKDLSVNVVDNQIYLTGDFKPGQKYRIRFLKGMKNTGGGMLESDAYVEITAKHLEPALEFVHSGSYFPLNRKDMSLVYQVRNCDAVTVDVLKAYENNLNNCFGDTYANRRMMVKIAKREIKLDIPKNVKVMQKIDLAELLGGRKPGVYQIELSSPSFRRRISHEVNVTDFAVTAVQDEDAGRFFIAVRSFSADSPVAGANVTVLSEKNQIAASGVTGENGTVSLKNDPKWISESDRAKSVFVKKGDQIAYFSLSGTAFSKTGYSEVYEKNNPRAFLFTERGVFRPGESFTAFAFLKKPSGNSFVPLKNASVTLELRDPYGNLVSTEKLRTDGHGFLQCAFSVPVTASSGVYQLNCRTEGASSFCGTASIVCSSYVPDRIKISGKCLTPNAGIADPISYEFGARYYFDAPLKEGSFRYRVSASPAPFPAHWESWNVGVKDAFKAPEPWFGKGVADGKKVTLRYPGFAGMNGKSFSPILITAMFHAAEPGGQGATANIKNVIYPTSWLIGLREAESSKLGKTVEYTLLSAKANEKIVLDKDVSLEFQLTRQYWDYVIVQTSSGVRREWRKVKTPLPKMKRTVVIPKGVFTAGTAKKVQWDLKSGEYILTVSSGSGRKTEIVFHHSEGDVGQRSENVNIIEFSCNAKQYKPGETAELSFESPADGSGILITGGKQMDETRLFPVKAGKNVLKIKIPENLHSSVLFTACGVICKSNGECRRMYGHADLMVDQSARHLLKVGIGMPEKAVPGAEIPVELTLTDSSGKPASGMVCLYGVDSGTLALTSYKTPDIYTRFFGPGQCPFSYHDMYDMFCEDLSLSRKSGFGGDGGIGGKLIAIKQKETARLIVPPVHISASGRAVLKIRLPDHTGSMNFYAVASAEDKVGSSMRSIKMRNRISVMLSAPRFLAPNDTAEISMTFLNLDADDPVRTGYRLDLPANIAGTGADPVLAASDVKKGGQKTLAKMIKAGENLSDGKISAEFEADSWKASDSRFITVRSIIASRTEREFHVLKPGETFVFKPGDGYIGRSSSVLRLSSSPALGVKSALNWLNEYPYGCLEQTAAGGFPFLALPVMEKTGLVDPLLARSSSHKAREAASAIMRMSLSDGSFSMWPGNSSSWKEGSLFALHFLAEGRKISNEFEIRGRSFAFLRKTAEDASPENRSNRAYAVYILSLLNDDSFIVNARNMIDSTEKPDFALMLAGASLIHGGFASIGIKPFRQALDAGCWRNEGVPTAFSDETCRLGMTLHIMMNCGIEDTVLASRLAFELSGKIRHDSSAWGTTHANAWAALGLSAYAAKYPPVKAEADMNGKRVSFEGIRAYRPESPVTIVNRSSGNLLVISETTGIPRDPRPSAGVLEVSKEYLNEDGKPVETVSRGDLIYVRLRFKSPREYENIVLCDLLPGGFEIENGEFATRASGLPEKLRPRTGAFDTTRIEKRDDRFVIFGNTMSGKSEFVYQIRAVTRGSFAIPPIHAESMYLPDVNGSSAGKGRLTVK